MIFLLLFLGVLLAVGAVAAARWFANADPQRVARLLRGLAIGGAVAAILLVLATGRASAAAVLGGLLLPFIGRWIQSRRAAATIGGASPGRRSTVSARFIAMELDHDTGVMSGRVTEGPLAGRDLASLAEPELAGLYRLCRGGDAESLRLLEAWLDRSGPADWRTRFAEDDPPPGAPGATGAGPMTEAEALRILGLEPGADAAAIDAAYRRLMRTAHPDAGGSHLLAARLNAARARLRGR